MSIHPSFSSNEWLVRAFLERIKGIPYLPPNAKNHIAFDSMVLGQISITSGVDTVQEAEWRTASKYEPFKRAISNRTFEFDDNFPVTDSSGLLVPAVIDKPNGSQNWPDLVIAFQRRAMPIECKSSKNGKITWNSGLPQERGVYVFNSDPQKGRGKIESLARHTTFFLGADCIRNSDLDKLKEGEELNHKLAKQVNDYLRATGSGWTLYARPMFNDSAYYLVGKEEVEAREQRVIEFISSFSWN